MLFAGASVALVDDDVRLREALAFQLTTAGLRVASFPSAADLLASKPLDFDCIVADIFLPGLSGLELQQRLIDTCSVVALVFITGRSDLRIGIQAMKSGAMDVLEKPVGDEVILASIARGIEYSRSRRAESSQRVALEVRFRSLPIRQREVFTLVTEGLLNKQVAAELRISERTVKVHRERLRRRMGADSLAELSRMAEVLGVHVDRRANASG